METDLIFRKGKFTASECYKLMGERGGITTQTAQTYILEKAAETLYDKEWIDTSSDSVATRWGKELEPDASMYYELAYKVTVEKPNPQCAEWSDEVSGSPDGLVYPDGNKVYGIEIKSPYNPTNHLSYMLMRSAADLKKTKKEYYWQVLCYMLIFGLDYYEFVSYDPRYSGANRMFVLPIKRKDVSDDIDKLKEALLQAVEEKHKILKMINN